MFRLTEPGRVAEAAWQDVKVAALSSVGTPARRVSGVATYANKMIGIPIESESRTFVRITLVNCRCCLMPYVVKKCLVGLDSAELDAERRVPGGSVRYRTT